MRIIWAPFARRDLVAIRQYISRRNAKAAKAVASHILSAATLLREQPKLGVKTHRDDVRRLVVANSVYSIFYRIRENDIEIIEIFDGRRKAPDTSFDEV